MTAVCARFMAAWLMGRPENGWADGSGDGGSSIGLSERSEEKKGRAVKSLGILERGNNWYNAFRDWAKWHFGRNSQ